MQPFILRFRHWANGEYTCPTLAELRIFEDIA